MDTFTSVVQSPLMQPLSMFAAAVTLLMVFWWRAGSIRSVLDRVWHLLAGRADVNDPVLKELLLNSRDLERFQFTYRLKVDSLAEVHKLHAWSNRYQFDIANLTRIRDWVDLKHAELIKAPPKRYVGWRVFIAIVLVATIYFLGALLLPSGALLHMKVSGVYFRAQETFIQHPFGLWKVGVSECKADLGRVVSETNFTRDEAELMCKVLTDGQAKALVDDNETAQRLLFAVVLVFFLGPLFFSTVWKASAAQAAFALRAQMTKLTERAEQESVEP